MMKSSTMPRTLFLLIALLVAVTHAFEEQGFSLLGKRDISKLPFDTLSGTSCGVPDVCKNLNVAVTCRCNDVVTVCQPQQGKGYCWGSSSLTQSTGCPSIPSSCSGSFNGTASCLCSSSGVLCVDGSRNYCYGTVSNGAVTLTTLPTASSASASVSSSSAPSSQPSTSSASTTIASSSAIVAAILVLTVAAALN
ncbi:hypothetical protein BC940DRAFT_295830 [Gongronella butleri]|nr:hypothetical protein BC940DRAFT_295830 [Gongronella butleri]